MEGLQGREPLVGTGRCGADAARGGGGGAPGQDIRQRAPPQRTRRREFLAQRGGILTVTAEALVAFVAGSGGGAHPNNGAAAIDFDVVMQHERHVAAGAAVKVKARPPAASLPRGQGQLLVAPAAQGAKGKCVSVIC